MKKYIAEMLGTMVLVLMGCGTAVSLSCTSADPNLAATVIGTALAGLYYRWCFGLPH